MTLRMSSDREDLIVYKNVSVAWKGSLCIFMSIRVEISVWKSEMQLCMYNNKIKRQARCIWKKISVVWNGSLHVYYEYLSGNECMQKWNVTLCMSNNRIKKDRLRVLKKMNVVWNGNLCVHICVSAWKLVEAKIKRGSVYV